MARLFPAYYPFTKSHAQRAVVLRWLGWSFWGGDRVAAQLYMFFIKYYYINYCTMLSFQYLFIWRPGISVACCTIIIQAVKNPPPEIPPHLCSYTDARFAQNMNSNKECSTWWAGLSCFFFFVGWQKRRILPFWVIIFLYAYCMTNITYST